MRMVVTFLALLIASACQATPDSVGMDPYVKDIIDAGAKGLGLLSVIFVGVGLFRTAQTRREDLRWRMASAAQDLLNELHEHRYASEAVNMFDCIIGSHLYSAPDKSLQCQGVDLARVCSAVSNRTATNEADVFIYRCIDWFLYYLDRIAYLDRQVLLKTEDVGSTLAPYAKIIVANDPCFRGIIADHGYVYVNDFLRRLATATSPRG